MGMLKVNGGRQGAGAHLDLPDEVFRLRYAPVRQPSLVAASQFSWKRASVWSVPSVALR
jgi:hypothetical protein